MHSKMPPAVKSCHSRPPDVESRRRRTPSTPLPRDSSSLQRPARGKSKGVSKSRHKETKDEEDDVREKKSNDKGKNSHRRRSSVGYIQSKTGSGRDHASTPDDSGPGGMINNRSRSRSSRSRSRPRRQLRSSSTKRAPPSQSRRSLSPSNSNNDAKLSSLSRVKQQPKHSKGINRVNSNSCRHIGLENNDNGDAIGSSKLSPPPYNKSSSQQPLRSRRSRSRGNTNSGGGVASRSKEHYHYSQHHQDFDNSDSQLVLNDNSASSHSRRRRSFDFDGNDHCPRNFSGAAERVDRLLAEAAQFPRDPNSNTEEDNHNGPSSSATKKSSSATSSKNQNNATPTHKNKSFNKIVSQISRVKERVRSRSRSKSRPKERSRSKHRDVDQLSEGPLDFNRRNMKNSTSASTLITATSTLITESSSVSANTQKTHTHKPTHPPPPPRRSNMSALVLVENDGNTVSSQSTNPGGVRCKSKGQESSRRSRTAQNISTNASFPPPPPPRRSNSTSLTLGKIQPALSLRRDGDNIVNGALQQDQDGQIRSSNNSPTMLLDNTNNMNIPTSNAMVPFTISKKCDNNSSSIPSATNQPHLVRQRSRNNKNHPVSSMGYTDPYGDSGLYSGEVDDESRPHGRGKMKYDNGIFYEGNWIHGSKDETQGDTSGDQQTNATRQRILSGFTSWKGQKKKDGKGKDVSDGGTFVYGMDWADLAGVTGKYTGQVNANNEPDGNGVMRYDIGLVAEGKWLKGKLNDGAGGGMGSGILAQSVAGGMSVAPGGMSVAGGAGTVVGGLGMMSIGGGGGGMMMGGYPNGMMYPQYMNNTMPMAASCYNPAGAMMAGAPVAVNYQQQPGMLMNHPTPTGNDNIPTNIMADENE